jgi:IS30 family transposase
MGTNYSHVTQADRISIQALLQAKLKASEIARRLNFSRSTICRELNRNKATPATSACLYGAGFAHERTKARRVAAAASRRKLGSDLQSPLWRIVLSGLQCNWSPEQIAGKLPRMNQSLLMANPDLDRDLPTVSHETIYGAIYAQPRGTLRTEFIALLRKTMTYDQGSEMALHETLSAKLHLEIYFCDPHSPWQRGSNENANGLIREYLPKGMDLSNVSHQQLTAIEQALNHRPRKILDFQSPFEVFSKLKLDLIAGVALEV